MILNRKGQQLWEVTLLLALLLGAFVWFNSTQKTVSNKFDAGSEQVQHTADSKPFFSLLNLTWSSAGETKTKVATPITQVVTQPVTQVVPVDTYKAPELTYMLGVPKEKLASIGHLSPLERGGLDCVIVLLVMIVGGLLDAIGGDFFLAARRFIMPFLVCAGISIITFTFYPVWYSWLAGLCVLPAMGTLCLGYPSGNNFGRGLWLFLQASLGFGLLLVVISYFFHVHLLAWWLYIIYVAICGIWGGIYKNWEQFFGDWITGSLGLCTIIFWVFLTLLLSL